MGVYFGVSAFFVFCLLGLSANAKDFPIGSPPGSDITKVSFIKILLIIAIINILFSKQINF